MEKDRLAHLETGNQNSTVDLNRNSGEEANQDSAGDLNFISNKSLLLNSESIEIFNLREIKPFTLIPDYLEPTLSKHPIVVKTPKSCHCIEGWDLVEKSRSEGTGKIRCFVTYLEESSMQELAIRKVAIRTLPQGGKASYAERIRNFYFLFELLMKSLENPVFFSHGGVRKGDSYQSNQEDDVRSMMEQRTGVSRTTISKYLNYAEYLNDEAIGILVASNTGRDFFEEAQKNKRILVKNLRHEEEPDANMAIKISTAMLKWLKEYKELGTIESILHLNENSTDGADGGSPSGKERAVLQAGRKFEHTVKDGDASEAEEPSTETIQNELMEVAHRIIGLATASNMTVRQILEEVKAVLTNLTQVHAKLVYLDRKQIHGNEGR